MFIPREEPFICEHCGFAVEPLERGTCRSHCPKCLWSKHVDHEPGDRASSCHGMMEPGLAGEERKKGIRAPPKRHERKTRKGKKGVPRSSSCWPGSWPAQRGS